MNLLILLGVVVVGSIFTVQNMQVVSLYFLGNSATTAALTLSLPLSFWAWLFILAGLITSLIFRGFLRSPSSVTREFPSFPPPRSQAKAPRPQSFMPEQPLVDSRQQSDREWTDTEDVDSWFEEEESPPPPVVNPQPPSDRPPAKPTPDWQTDLRSEAEYREPIANDYFVDEPRERRVDIRLDRSWQEAIADERPKEQGFTFRYEPPPEREGVPSPRQVPRPVSPPAIEDKPGYHRSNFEVPQTPRSETRQGTIYTYSYKDPRDRPQESSDRTKAPSSESPQLPEKKPSGIFDVNYRLLNPPSRPVDDRREDEEDWI